MPDLKNLNLNNHCLFQPFLKELNRFAGKYLHQYFIVLLLILLGQASFAQGVTTLKGEVRSANGELISGVTVKVKNTRLITQSDRSGSYLFNSVPLKVALIFSRLGYKSLTLEVGLLSAQENIQNVTLFPEIQYLDEVHITEKFNGSNLIYVDPAKFQTFPQVSGSFESLIKNLPGVSANNELISQYSVRGGNFDENLVYLNDIEIFRPLLTHNGQQEGLGVINPDMTGTVRFSAGGFEARYGDKLSSVLDVKYARPDTFSLEASVGLLGSSATLKLPFKNSYLLAGIRNKNNQSLLSRQDIKGDYKTDFSDYQLLYNKDIGTKLSMSFFGNYNKGNLMIIPGNRESEFGTSDQVLRLFVNYDGKEADHYESHTSALTLAYRASNTLNFKWISSVAGITEVENFNLLGWYTFNEKDVGVFPGKAGLVMGRGSIFNFADNKLKSLIYNTEFRAYKQVSKLFFEMGVRFQNDQLNDRINGYTANDSTGYSSPGSGNWIYSDVINEQNLVNIGRMSGFLQNTFSLSPYFTIASGIRANYNSYTRETLLSPRVSLMYYPGDMNALRLRFSAGLYAQPPYYHEIRNFNGTLNKDAKSQRSHQLLTGADYMFAGLGTRLKLTSELYYKFLNRLTPYRMENLKMRYLAEQSSNGYAAGADFSLSGNFAKDLESSFRISFMKTEEDIKDDFYLRTDGSDKEFVVWPGYLKRPFDQRINMGMLFQDRLKQNPTYKVHLNLVYASTLPVGPPGNDRYRDVFKIPAYKRVDIGFSKDFADPESKRIPTFIKRYFQSLSAHAEIFNLLNIKNTVSYLWISDVNNNQYAVPNYLTYRKFNFRIIAKLKSR